MDALRHACCEGGGLHAQRERERERADALRHACCEEVCMRPQLCGVRLTANYVTELSKMSRLGDHLREREREIERERDPKNEPLYRMAAQRVARERERRMGRIQCSSTRLLIRCVSNLVGNVLAGDSESLLGSPTVSRWVGLSLPTNWKRIVQRLHNEWQEKQADPEEQLPSTSCRRQSAASGPLRR